MATAFFESASGFGIHFYNLWKSMIYYNQQVTHGILQQTVGGNIMNDAVKGMLIVLVIVYIISPIDITPGPIDDVIVLLLGLASSKRIGKED